MLEYLRIRDLALIEDMALEFGSGMNALTGETGAGKTFILKAINFLLGEKMGADLVRPGAEKAQVEALFARPDGDLVLRRELVAETGRSRFFLNGDLSSQEAARELRPGLILHAGQHGQQRLLQPAYQAFLVDSFLPSPEMGRTKDELFKQLKRVAEERQALLRKIEHLRERRDVLEMQQKDIDKVSPEPGEEEKLERIRLALRSAAGIRELYDRGLMVMRGENGQGLLDLLGSLDKVVDQLIAALQNLSPDPENAEFSDNAMTSGQDPFPESVETASNEEAAQFASMLESLRAFREEAQEMERIFRQPPRIGLPSQDEENSEYDTEELESRLFELAQLKRKLKRSLPEILELKEEIEENLSFLDACGLDLKHLDRRETELASRLYLTLQSFNTAREQASNVFCETLQNELKGLGFSDQVRVIPEVTPHEIWPPVGEVPACVEKRVRLLWAPNPGQSPQALDRIASGGELSRFLLAVVSIQAEQEAATLIFDEVDAGVGGITLNRVAERLEHLASRRQMLLITHWPQLAARAGTHFRVTKEIVENQTYTRCQKLDATEREAELARMAGQE